LTKLKLYIIRHGATIWNKEALYTGQTDVPLNEEGYQQAEKISQRLAGEGLQAVYSSALSRAVATAQIVARPHALTPHILPGLLEVNFGAWEGHPYTYVREHYAEALHRWNTDPVNFRIPEGEALTDIRDRVSAALDLILQAHPEGAVAAVAHSGSIRMLFCLLLKMDLTAFWRIMQYSGALNLVEFRNGVPTVLSVNGTDHLLD
jgi:alpha-ribazole phosphatase